MPTDPTLDERMAGLARDLQTHDLAADTLQHIVEAAVDLLDPCDSAGISLASRDGGIETSACTDDLTRRADKLQQECGEGPCMDAVWNEPVVWSPDLTTEVRWPRWGPAAASELGIRSSLCVRLFTHEDRVGGLNLFSTQAEAFSPQDVSEARAIAAHAAVALIAVKKITQLDTALHSRTATAQATGLIMARYEVSSHQAFAILKRLSNERNVKLRTIAEEMVRAHDGRASR